MRNEMEFNEIGDDVFDPHSFVQCFFLPLSLSLSLLFVCPLRDVIQIFAKRFYSFSNDDLHQNRQCESNGLLLRHHHGQHIIVPLFAACLV